MKKLLLCMLVLVMSLALFACGGTGDETTDPSGNNTDPSHVHAYEEVVILEPTCIATGKKAMQCSCGDIQSEEELPMGDHNASMADCENDAVCSVCGTVLVEKFGHDLVETVVTEATCSNDGLTRGLCQLCGASVDTVVPADPEKHVYDYVFTNGSISSSCKGCGKVETLTEQTPILDLKFDSESELSNFPNFVITSNAPTYTDGYIQTNGGVFLEHPASDVTSAEKLYLTFDFQIVQEGNKEKGESLFTFVPIIEGKKNWNWVFKYFETEGVVATVQENFDETNSVKVNHEEWHNCSAIFDPVACEVKVYIDGKYIGARTTADYSQASKAGLRFTEGACTSNPKFDNFKLVEIK